ncbi:Uncharacterised protein [Mycobacterium tuberculosis]|nr:Uncharacterised protein [Mycobacterium tuberculosis]
MRADTSSAPASSTCVVAAAAALLAALIVDPTFARSPAAADTTSGEINTNDTDQLQTVGG